MESSQKHLKKAKLISFKFNDFIDIVLEFIVNGNYLHLLGFVVNSESESAKAFSSFLPGELKKTSSKCHHSFFQEFIKKGDANNRMILKLNLYENTCETTTKAIFEIDSTEEVNIENLEIDFSVFEKINESLTKKSPTITQYESIVINRPFSLIKNYISNFPGFVEEIFGGKCFCADDKNDVGSVYYVYNSKEGVNFKYTVKKIIKSEEMFIFRLEKVSSDKANKLYMNLSLVKLSSVSTYLIIEEQIDYYLNSRILQRLSQLNQKILKKVKAKNEKRNLFFL